jgi:hypothetical protein
MLEAVSGLRYVVAQISQKNYKPAEVFEEMNTAKGTST